MVISDSEMEITEEEFQKVINNSSHKVIVVNFFAEWHMPCLMLTPILEDLADQLKEIKFVKINIDDNEELAEKYNISTLPCLVILKEGVEIDRIIKCPSSEVIEQKLKSCIK